MTTPTPAEAMGWLAGLQGWAAWFCLLTTAAASMLWAAPPGLRRARNAAGSPTGEDAVVSTVPSRANAVRAAGAGRPEDGARPPTMPRALAGALAGGGVLAVVPSPLGALAGAVVGVGAFRWLASLEPTGVRAAREAAAAELPLVAGLLAACVSSGAPLEDSLEVVASSAGPALRRRLAPALAATSLGRDPAVVWAELGSDVVLAPLARPLARAHASGAPLADALTRAVDDVRAAQRARSEAALERASVQVAGPLGLCFLPAFVLVGVVPLVVAVGQGVARW